MNNHVVCDRTPNTPKIRILKGKSRDDKIRIRILELIPKRPKSLELIFSVNSTLQYECTHAGLEHKYFRKCFVSSKYGYDRSGSFCLDIQARDLCDGSQLMYFICSSLSCQAMFRVRSVLSFAVTRVPKSSSCRNSFPQNLKVPCYSLPTKNCCNTEFMASAPSGR